jgi:hypothetical protein
VADITLWLPEPDLIIHQAMGKVGEEAGELATIVSRCLIQGVDGVNPTTGKPNRQALEEEIADVFAAARWLRDVGGLRDMQAREERKLAGFREWQAMLEASRG